MLAGVNTITYAKSSLPALLFPSRTGKNATIKNNQINKEIEEKPVEELKEVKRDPKSKKKKRKENGNTMWIDMASTPRVTQIDPHSIFL